MSAEALCEPASAVEATERMPPTLCSSSIDLSSASMREDMAFTGEGSLASAWACATDGV